MYIYIHTHITGHVISDTVGTYYHIIICSIYIACTYYIFWYVLVPYIYIYDYLYIYCVCEICILCSYKKCTVPPKTWVVP